MPDTPDNCPPARSDRLPAAGWCALLLLTAVALLLRLRALGQEPLINNDAVAFYPLWEAFLNGTRSPGAAQAALDWPPLYPVLSVLTARLFSLEPEPAMRLLSVAAGTLLIPATYLLGERLVSWRVGLLAALFAALWGPLVRMSTFAYDTMLYTLLATLALVALLLPAGKWGRGVLAGTCLGLAYLCRPEAALLVLVAAAWLWYDTRRAGQRPAAWVVGAPLVAFVCFAAINLVLLHAQTGAWALPKAVYNLLIDIAPRRVLLNPEHTAVLVGYEVGASPWGYVLSHPRALLVKYVHNAWLMLSSIPPHLSWTGGWVLAGCALGAGGLRRNRGSGLMLAWGLPLLVLPLFLTVVVRVYAWLLPPLLVLMAMGLAALSGQVAGERRRPRIVWTVILGVVALLPAVPAGLRGPSADEVAVARVIRGAGEQLRQDYGEGRLMISMNETPFYARGRMWALPEDPPGDILDFIRRAEVEFLVLDTIYASEFPLLAEWFAGKAPPGWRLLRRDQAAGRTMWVYDVRSPIPSPR